MSRGARSVLIAATCYALFVAVSSAVTMRLDNPVLPGIALALLGIAGLAAGSAWVARSAGERDMILPAAAAALGWPVGILAFALVTPQYLSIEFLAGSLTRSLSLGLIVPLTQASSPIPLFTLAGTSFGFGFPWALIVIYSVVLWNRRRRRLLGTQTGVS